MGGRERGGNLSTKGLARLLADVSTEVVDTIIDVSTRAGAHLTKKDEAAPSRQGPWWNSPEPPRKQGTRRGRSRR